MPHPLGVVIAPSVTGGKDWMDSSTGWTQQQDYSLARPFGCLAWLARPFYYYLCKALILRQYDSCRL
jgi:hypothetical protein